MMISLLDLPNELLLYIGEISPISALNSLILTNHRLAELLNPILWQFEQNAAENMGLDPADLSMEFQLEPSINNAVELLPYAVSTNNTLMIRKILQNSYLDYQMYPDTMNYMLQVAADAGRDEWVHMLLTTMEEQHEKFDTATVLATVQSAMDRNDLAITERLLWHGKISKRSWINIGKHALNLQNEQLLRIILDCSQTDPAPGQADLNQILHYAAFIGHAPSVVLLSERGADVNMPGLDTKRPSDTPLHTAARRNNINAVAWMINHGAYTSTQGSKEQTVATEAIDKLPTLHLFASHEPDICQRDCCRSPRLTRETCSKHFADFLYPPLFQGLQPGSPSFGVEARQFDRYVMSLAFSTSLEMISLLLNQLDMAQIGEEILFRASFWRGNRLLLKELFARGVSFAARRKGNNVLHCIVGKTFDPLEEGHVQHNIDAAEFVIDVRPEALSEAGKDGNTPLHLAFYDQQPFLVTTLLKRGASPHVYNNHGVTPLGFMPDYWGDKSQQMFAPYL
jgi:ankyrin repeat protein